MSRLTLSLSPSECPLLTWQKPIQSFICWPMIFQAETFTHTRRTYRGEILVWSHSECSGWEVGVSSYDLKLCSYTLLTNRYYHPLKGFGVTLKPERQSFAWNQRRHLFLSPQEAMFETHCKLILLMTGWMKKPTDQTERSLQRFWPPTYNSCHWMSTRMNWTDHRVEERRSSTLLSPSTGSP